jgi:hypothetical protein
MKNTQSLPRIAFLTLALGTASVTAAFAQTTPTTTPTTPAPTTPVSAQGPGINRLGSVLTPAEKAQLEKDHNAVLAANPELKTEADNLKAQHEALKSQGASASADAKAALKAARKEHEEKMQIAMLKIDPSVAPILAKLKAAHKENHAASNA